MSDTHIQAVRALEVLCARIRRDIATGGALEGLKFYESFETRREKHDDLPRVYITDYVDREDHGGGAPRDDDGSNSVLRNQMTVGIQLVVDKRNGWITPISEDNIKKIGALNMKAHLIDRLETNDAGNEDCELDGTCDKPVMFNARESGVFDLGIVMDINVIISPIRFHRTERAAQLSS